MGWSTVFLVFGTSACSTHNWRHRHHRILLYREVLLVDPGANCRWPHSVSSSKSHQNTTLQIPWYIITHRTTLSGYAILFPVLHKFDFVSGTSARSSTALRRLLSSVRLFSIGDFSHSPNADGLTMTGQTTFLYTFKPRKAPHLFDRGFISLAQS